MTLNTLGVSLALLLATSILCFAANAKETDIVNISANQNGATVEAKTGQTIVIHLKGNPTTGFSWYALPVQGDSVKHVKMEYVRDDAAAGRVGAGGTFVATYTAEKAGKSTLKLEYKRPWEKDRPPVEKFSVSVEVK